MNVSKYLKVDENLKKKRLKQYKIKRNQTVKDCYLLCTASKEDWLFEIIEGTELNQKFEACYLLGISSEKEWLITYVVELVDALYNKKSIEYTMLKAQ